MLESSRRLWPRIAGLPGAVVPNTIDVAAIKQQASAEPPAWFPGDGPVVMFSGRLEQRKGAHVLGDAMADVWRAHPRVRFVIAGGGDDEWQGRPMSSYLMERAGKHRDQLHLVGAVPARELFPALRRARVVALPSLWESFSLAALESMAVGRPLIATTGVFPDFVRAGVNALLAPAEDSKRLAELVNQVLDQPELGDRLGRGGTQTAADHDVKVVSEHFLETLSVLTHTSV